MKKATKGALAAGLGAVLLVGGGGTLASWTSSTTPGGATTINSGYQRLVTDTTNAGCGSWTLDDVVGYQVGDPIVPGDVLRLNCKFTIQAAGASLTATVAASSPSFSGATALSNDLHMTVSSLKVGGTTATSITGADNGKTLSADVTITFDSLSTNASQNLSSALSNLTLTATQVP